MSCTSVLCSEATVARSTAAAQPASALDHSIPSLRQHLGAPLADTCDCNSRYADHVGIHYVLCSKLRQFAYEELEFFLPQYVAREPSATASTEQLAYTRGA